MSITISDAGFAGASDASALLSGPAAYGSECHGLDGHPTDMFGTAFVYILAPSEPIMLKHDLNETVEPKDVRLL